VRSRFIPTNHCQRKRYGAPFYFPRNRWKRWRTKKMGYILINVQHIFLATCYYEMIDGLWTGFLFLLWNILLYYTNLQCNVKRALINSILSENPSTLLLWLVDLVKSYILAILSVRQTYFKWITATFFEFI